MLPPRARSWVPPNAELLRPSCPCCRPANLHPTLIAASRPRCPLCPPMPHLGCCLALHPQLHGPRTVLLGDAGHPMTSTLAQVSTPANQCPQALHDEHAGPEEHSCAPVPSGPAWVR